MTSDTATGVYTGLAIFDLDNTLLAGDSDHAWGDYLATEGIVDAQTQAEANDRFYQDYLDGTLDIHRYLEFALQPLTRHPLAKLHAWREDFIRRYVEPMVTDQARKLVADHRQRGHYLLIITATNRFVTEPIADLLGVDDLIATDPEMRDGVYTGKVAGTPSFQDGKVKRLADWRRDHPVPGHSWFYSDSHNDLPLLEQVDNPIVVDPDPRLASVARDRQWPIISLRD